MDESVERTAESIRAQSILATGEAQLTYIIQCSDPCADTRKIEMILQGCQNLSFEIICEQDSGVYDALSRGFSRGGDADMHGYLGAGDLLSPNALEIVNNLHELGVDWVTGLICGYNNKGHLIEASVPFQYRAHLIRQGFYGTWLPFIQQESTFWSKRLHETINWEKLRNFQLAGDAYLWHNFATQAPLEIVEAWLGGFEHRRGQLSRRRRDEYIRELRSIADARTAGGMLSAALDWIVWRTPRKIRRALAPARFLYDEAADVYRKI